MNRLRRSLDELTPSQRATLGLLTVLVVAAAAAAVVAATSRTGEQTASSDSTIATPSTPPTSEATTVPTTSPETTTSTTNPSTTTTEPSTTTSTTSTTVPVTTLVLRVDGLDGSYFGVDASVVLDSLRESLGEPDEDTGWVDKQENYTTCIGENVRFVRWGSFQAFFTDGQSEWRRDGVRHFASYTQAVYFDGEVMEAETTDGLTLGSPVGDIRALYGQESVYDDLLYGPVFIHDPPGAALQWGAVSGLAADDTIESINGSRSCGE